MIVYHGTTADRARLILNEKRIRATTPELSRYPVDSHLASTCGYVYVSDDLNVAWGYAIETSSNQYPEGERTYFVFMINIHEDEVEEDIDDATNPAYISQLYPEGGHCFRVKRDLLIGSDVVSYLSLPIPSYKLGCCYADNPRFTQEIQGYWEKL